MSQSRRAVTRSLFSAARLEASDDDVATFDAHLKSFVPPDAFDAHAHFYRLEDLEPTASRSSRGAVGRDAFLRLTRGWMGELAPRNGLFFALPAKTVEANRANEFTMEEAARFDASRALLLIRPSDEPEAIAATVAQHVDVVAGFKVYHVFASRQRTMDALIEEFVPEWAWELADRHGLSIVLHLVRSRSLADAGNQKTLRDRCLRYTRAKLILAHAARGFCTNHVLDGIDSLRGLDNVFFDTSAICEPAPLQAIVQRFGTRRLLYGSDFPVSNLRGRCTGVGDGFFWMYAHNVDWQGTDNLTAGKPTLVGIESLLALRHACRLLHLTDTDVQRIFSENARRELGLQLPREEAGQGRYETAKQLIPGGTQLLSKRPEMFAPDRWPPYFSEARGVEVIDGGGRSFIDMSTMAVGSCLLGYADPDVDAAVSRRVLRGSMTSLNSADEVDLAEALIELHPWAEKVRYARSGGEAMAIAVRLARASTGRDKVAFCGYHGWHDWYLAANLRSDGPRDPLAGHLMAGLEPAGVPRSLAGTSLPFSYNRLDEIESIVRSHGSELAAIVMEPTRSQHPLPGFLESVGRLATSCGAVFIFDEISAGWRFHLGGAHLRYGVEPDMAVFSKATGNGFPIAAILGVAAVMEAAQRTFVSSTMWTEGIGPAAALATLRKMKQHDVPRHVERIGAAYRDGLQRLATAHGVSIRLEGHAPLTTVLFEQKRPAALQTLFTARMLERGFLAGAAFYPSLAHEIRHVDACLEAAASVFRELSEAVSRGDVEERLRTPVKQQGFRRLA